MYTLLEQEVVPAFYTRDADGIPTAWVARMRESMAQLTPRFSANRTVREYTEQLLPAGCGRLSPTGCRSRGVGSANPRLAARPGATLGGGPLRRPVGGDHRGSARVPDPVYLGALDPDAIQVELYANALNGAAPLRQAMTSGERLPDANGYVYSARVPAERPAADYTPRIIPHHPEAAVPLEAAQMLWQR